MSGSNDREILNVEEAAALLGVSVKTFNKVLHSQSLPARKIGREWKFSRRALIDWVGSGRSDHFYKEAGGPRNAAPVGEAEGAHAGRPGANQDGRRTRGWRLELD